MTYAYYVLEPFRALYRLSSEIYSLVEPEPDQLKDRFTWFRVAWIFQPVSVIQMVLL